MKLHTVDRELPVLQPHDLALIRFAGDLQAVWQRFTADHEGMVAHRFERVLQPREYPQPLCLMADAFPCMSHGAGAISPPKAAPMH
jgi:hypothetical protein